jgi:gamma-glutamyltranspeptidase/glutathione hydrolase/leukotriene-C4 hydrolase
MQSSADLHKSKERSTITEYLGDLDEIRRDRTNDRVVLQIVGLGLLVLIYWWPWSVQRPDAGTLLSDHTEARGAWEQHGFGVPRNPAYLVKAYRGAVAAENEACSQTGVEVLRKGGNAVDAAISATFCTGVVNMFS